MDRTGPLVSVVTPSYNSAQFIGRCIESVLAQGYPFVEHIIQDGGSTDGTRGILERYTGLVDWVSEPDGGQSDGLDRALKRCRGDVIGVLNADDEYLPHACAWAAEHLAEHPYAAGVYGDQYDIDSEGNIVHETHGKPYDFARVFCVEDVIPAQAAFIRRYCLEAVGLRADVTRRTCPDYEIWVRLGMQFPMVHVPGFVAKYRWHPGSEGRAVHIIEAMVRSKREVIERTVNDPLAPERVRALRWRAHAGAIWWGISVMTGVGGMNAGTLGSILSLAEPGYSALPGIRRFLPALVRYAPRRKIARTIVRTIPPSWRAVIAVALGCFVVAPLVLAMGNHWGEESVTKLAVTVLGLAGGLIVFKSARYALRRMKRKRNTPSG